MFNRNTKILIIFLLIVVIALSSIYLIAKTKRQTVPQEPIKLFSPNPTSTPFSYPTVKPSIDSSGPQPGRSYSYSTETNISERKRQEAEGQLINKLPYTGKNFSLTYDTSSDTFYAVINPDNTNQGNQELDDYLKSQGISDRNQIKKLVVK